MISTGRDLVGLSGNSTTSSLSVESSDSSSVEQILISWSIDISAIDTES